VAVQEIRDLLVNTDKSMAERLRQRRWEFVRPMLPELENMKVLDLGGSTDFWRRAPIRPRHVTIVNLETMECEAPWLEAITGDACAADQLLVGRQFDLVFSNSLIEHVGGHSARVALAGVIRTLAPSYLVQTPYRYFPIEPHWIFPGMQFLPVPVQRRIAPRWWFGHTRGWSASDALEAVMATELIGATEMRAYFPDGQLLWERVLGIPKSMIVIRQS